MRRKKTLSLDPETVDVLARLPCPSRYVDHVVAQRGRAWRDALGALRRFGAHLDDVFAATEDLRGAHLSLTMAAEDLADAAGNVGSNPWHRVRRIAHDQAHATALVVVALELRAGNRELELILRGDDAAP